MAVSVSGSAADRAFGVAPAEADERATVPRRGRWPARGQCSDGVATRTLPAGGRTTAHRRAVFRHRDHRKAAERGESADAAIAGFNAETGHDYAADHFLTYWKSNLEDFALEAARPARPKVANVTRDELIEIVRRIQAADDDIDYYVLLLDTNVLHPRVTDLIFWPPPELVNASPGAIVDAALSFRPSVCDHAPGRTLMSLAGR